MPPIPTEYRILAGGVLLLAVAWVWLLVRAFHTHKAWGWCLLLFPPTLLPFLAFRLKRARGPLALMLLGGAVITTALLYPQIQERFFPVGEHERMVEGELHLTLTGWDKNDYSLLDERPDAVVVQMANPDVTDETLRHLSAMMILKELDLSNTGISDEGLAAVAALPALKSLRLANTKITDDGFRKHLMDKESLLELDLTGTRGVASKTLRQWKAGREGRRFVN